MEESKIKGKKVECVIGIFFLIPPILGVISFVVNLLGCDGIFAQMRNLSSSWTGDYYYSSGKGTGSGGYTSAAPIYLGLMALAGVWLVKDSIQYLFYKSNK